MNWYVSKQYPWVTWGLDDLLELLKEQAESFEVGAIDDANPIYLWGRRGRYSLLIYDSEVLVLVDSVATEPIESDPVHAILKFLGRGDRGQVDD